MSITDKLEIKKSSSHCVYESAIPLADRVENCDSYARTYDLSSYACLRCTTGHMTIRNFLTTGKLVRQNINQSFDWDTKE